MNIPAVVAAAAAAVLLLLAWVFRLVNRRLTRPLDRTTTGHLVDVTGDARSFNLAQGQPEPVRPARLRVQVSAGQGPLVCRVYSYTVGTVTYTRADNARYSQSLALKGIGKPITVHYDSADPGTSTLGVDAFGLVARILLWVAFALLALAAWLFICCPSLVQ